MKTEGRIEMEVRLGVFTVIRSVPDTVPDVAVIVVVPAFIAVSRPEPLTVAIDVFELCQFASEVRDWVLLSE